MMLASMVFMFKTIFRRVFSRAAIFVMVMMVAAIMGATSCLAL